MMDSPAARIVRSIRQGWWLIVLTPVLLMGFTAFFVSRAQPEYVASGLLRIDPERPRVGLEALNLLGMGRGGGIMTELTAFQTRAAALETDALVGVRFRLVAPRGDLRSRYLSDLASDPGAAVTELRFTRRGDGFSLEPRVQLAPERWRPFARTQWATLPAVSVAPGGAFEVAGVRGRLVSPIPVEVTAIVLRVEDDEGLFKLMEQRFGAERFQREADVVRLHFRDADPEIARDVVNTMAERFMVERAGLQRRRSGGAATVLENQLLQVRADLVEAEAELLAFRERAGVRAPQAQIEGALRRLAELEGERDRLESEATGLRTLLAEVSAAGTAGSPGATGAAPHPLRRLVGYPTLLMNAAAVGLLDRMGELDNEYAALMVTRTPADPQARLLEGRIREVEGQLRSVAETYLDGLDRRLEALDARLQASEDALDQVPQVELEFLRRAQDVEFFRELALALEVRLREAQILGQIDESEVRLIDPARAPSRPTHPRPGVALAVALLLGIGLGGTGAVVRYGL
jgi:uncharacterized protein involved in exopolysaccharide biosynthesis